jgi:hypothetical protein
MATALNFYSTFPKSKLETDEAALRKSIAMLDKTDSMIGGISKRSTYKMVLPFRVLTLLSKGSGCLVLMMDKGMILLTWLKGVRVR